MDLGEIYSGGGLIISPKLFAHRFDKIPNKHTLTFNQSNLEIELSKLSDNVIMDIIPNVFDIIREVSEYTTVNNQNNTVSDKFDLTINNLATSNAGSTIRVLTNNKLFYIDFNSITCYYTDADLEEIKNELKEYWNKFPRKTPAPKDAVVNLVGFSNGDYYTIESKVKYVDINIQENYNDDFLPVYEDITKFLDSRDSGLILLYGDPGTGKSSIIRNLCCQNPHDYIIVPTSLTSRLGDPDFVSFMIDNANSVFILEDCEQILMDRGVNVFNGAISNILNMSDGLLSDILNIKFICTFNADVAKIDSALLRKGRCYAKYEFKNLTEDKVKVLNDKYNLGLDCIKEMSLADIYNADKKEYIDKKPKKKIGF